MANPQPLMLYDTGLKKNFTGHAPFPNTAKRSSCHDICKRRERHARPATAALTAIAGIEDVRPDGFVTSCN